MATKRTTNEEIVAAYKETGSVWKAAKKLGLCGQSVHERLVRIGHSLSQPHWTYDETEELKSLVGKHTIGEMASLLGRPYGTVASKLSDLGISARMSLVHKIPRGMGFDKKTIQRHIKKLSTFHGPLRHYCRKNRLHVEAFVKAIQRHFPDWWKTYVSAHSTLPLKKCSYCDAEFIPFSNKQATCSRKCQAYARFDKQYFSGNRRYAVGMAEGVCQLCAEPKERLSAHHLFGKENDPEDKNLIALCAGCHRIITVLAARNFAEKSHAWENLINIVLCRRAHKNKSFGVLTSVEMEWLNTQEEYDAA